jgi:hypothetical protein
MHVAYRSPGLMSKCHSQLDCIECVKGSREPIEYEAHWL